MPPATTTVLELAANHPETIGERLSEQARLIPHKVLLVTGERAVTFRQMEDMANGIACGFATLGVGKGDAVCQLMPNCEAVISNWMGLAKLGAINAPLNYQFFGAALARIVNATEAKLLVLDQTLETSIADIVDELPFLETIIFRAGKNFVRDKRLARFAQVNLADLEEPGGKPTPVQVHYSDPTMMMFTSGTTGASKAVEISHRYALAFAAEYIEHWRLTPEDVFYVPYPLYHVDANFAAYLSSLHRGGKGVVLSRFSASRFWDEIRVHGVTHTLFMGAVATFLFNRPERPDDADNPLRLVMTVPMPAFWREFEKRFGLKIVSGFGATELNMVCWDHLDAPHIDDTAGRPCEHFEMRIGDDHDEALPVGVGGEILVRPRRAYTMMTSYYKNPEATAETWRNLWHHTGDVGYMDEAGYLHFLGRKKDSIRRRGENISAFEVEEVLDSHPAVVESAVFGVPSEYTEEEVKTVLALRVSDDCTPAEIVSWAKGKLPRYALPRYVEFVDELPHTDTGKVQKTTLREQWRTAVTFDIEKNVYLEE